MYAFRLVVVLQLSSVFSFELTTISADLYQEASVESLLGTYINLYKFNPSEYPDKPMLIRDDLNCNFERNCCWQNENPPGDQLDFVKASGELDKSKTADLFGTTDTPTNNFLLVATTSQPLDGDQARFMSCTTACTNEEIKISLKYWITVGVKLQACLQDRQGGLLLNCKTFPFEQQPGPTTVVLPPVQNANIVLIASGFVSGSVAIIDDIQTIVTRCQALTPIAHPLPPQAITTSTIAAKIQKPFDSQPDRMAFVATPPQINIDKTTIFVEPTVTTATPIIPVTDPALCSSVVCNFEEGTMCNYQISTASIQEGNRKTWAAMTGSFKNPATGIWNTEQGQIYTAVNLLPKESAAMETTANFQRNMVIRFLVYKIAADIELKACCDDTDHCPYSTELNVQLKNFRKWQQAEFACPKGTNKIIFFGINGGKNEGAIGIDDIRLFNPNGVSPNGAGESAC